MKDLTVIVPIHEYNEEIEKYLENAIDSFNKTDEQNSNVIHTIPKNKLLHEIKIYKN